jgi:hypothetical protein
MEKLPHYFPWIVSFQKQRHMRDASSDFLNCLSLRTLSALSEADFSVTRRMSEPVNKYVMYFIHVSRTYFITDSGRCKSYWLQLMTQFPQTDGIFQSFIKRFPCPPESSRASSCRPACSVAIRLTNSYF